MPAPEQPIPGAEGNEHDVTPRNHRTRAERSSANSRPRRKPPYPPPEQDNWFKPTQPGDIEDMPVIDPRQDDQDLPPDTDYDAIREDIETNFDVYDKMVGINYETLIQRGLEHSTPDEMRAYLKQVISREREITRKNNEHENSKYERQKDSKVFTLKMFLGYSIGVLFLVFIIAFIVLFTYIVIKDGTLGESGIGLSIINTIQEVLRIILTTGSSNY